jgi:hypothetical protein
MLCAGGELVRRGTHASERLRGAEGDDLLRRHRLSARPCRAEGLLAERRLRNGDGPVVHQLVQLAVEADPELLAKRHPGCKQLRATLIILLSNQGRREPGCGRGDEPLPSQPGGDYECLAE